MLSQVHSCYSMGFGTLAPEDLVQKAATLGYTKLVLTDINNTSAAYPFIKACKKYAISPILGIDFRQKGSFRYIGIAKNAEGWHNLCAFLSHHSLTGTPLPLRAPQLNDVFFVYRRTKAFADSPLRADEFIGVRVQEVHRMRRSDWRNTPEKLIAFHAASFGQQADYALHKLLRCIDQNIILGQLQASSCAQGGDYLHSPLAIERSWAVQPEFLQRTKSLLASCTIAMPSNSENNRIHFTASRSEDVRLLRKLAYSGCLRRYGEDHTKAWARLEQELRVIQQLDFAAYFLITWDIIRYAQSVGYHHVGRGSGANSIVAYCMFITDVDPLELDLYFERFINPHRSSPPDFDIDFSWDERDDVTEYVITRYGADYTALLATYNTYKGKSIIRELGKVLGLPKSEIDRLIRHPNDASHHAYAKHIMHYGKQLEGLPRYLSIHAGGILISQRPLYYHTALRMMPKGFPITHFDMYTAEDLHFHKYDILSQRGLGHIKSAVSLIRENQGRAVDIHHVTRIKKDPNVKAQLRSGQCIGCFYIESPAMRGLLHKLKCDSYIELVAASSIIRPGVAKSGMMRAYIERAHDKSFSYIHPVFQHHLSETYGIMVYQEDVMKIVHHFAGLDLDESDILRRIMTGKKKSGDQFERLKNKYVRNCRSRGYSDALSREVWRQIESFSGYSFCKAHSASFAVESFQSLYLKTYYPLEFMVAVINNFGGFYRTEIYVHEARMMGGTIHAPCINHSRVLTHLYGTDIYLGFIHLKGFSRELGRQIEKEREANGPFSSLPDALSRLSAKKEDMEILIRIGAFACTGRDKCSLLWELHQAFQPKTAFSGQPLLVEAPLPSYQLPEWNTSPQEQAFDEIELLGFPLCSPFALLKEKVQGVPARKLSSYVGQNITMIGYYVTRKHVTTVRKEHMNFGTWLDEEGRFFDTTHFPKVLRQFPFQGSGCYRLGGKVVTDFGFCSLDVITMEKLPWVSDERYQ